MKFDCRPVIIADMKTITATPIATPATMKTVCSRPSRRKRIATIHSNGCHDLNIWTSGRAYDAAGGATRIRAPDATSASAGTSTSPSPSPSMTSA